MENAWYFWMGCFYGPFLLVFFGLQPFNIQINLPAWVAWSAWVLLWTHFAYQDEHKRSKQAAPKTVTQTPTSRYIHLFFAGVSFTGVNFTDGQFHEPFVFFAPAVFWIIVGWVLMIGGLLFAIWARKTLGEQWRGIVEVRDNHKLITAGPYGITRHPIYTGLFAMGLGSVITGGGALSAWINYIIMIIVYLNKIQQEEAFLITQFKAQYALYRKRTPKVFPGVHFI